MELHFVHYNSKYKDIGEAIQNEDGLAVLGVLFELSPYDNPNLNPLLNAIPAIQKGMGVYFFEKSLSFQSPFYALFSKFLNFLIILAQN